MKVLSNKFSYLFVIISLITGVAGCQVSKTSILELRYSPTDIEDNAETIAPQKIKLISFTDIRETSATPEKIGHREAAFNISMGDVHTDIPVELVIYSAFKNEIINMGHQIVEQDEELELSGKILNFWVGTEVTPAYWDVYGEVQLEVEVKKANGSIVILGPYYAKNKERTFVNPSIPIMERVLLLSIKEVVINVLSDEKLKE